MRADLNIVADWIEPESRILDLGCGDGSMLARLKDQKNIFDCGLEIDAEKILKCLYKGVNVIEQNLNKGLDNFENNSFDTVLLTQTLQAMQRPDELVEEMLRIGRNCIITFPNFGYWHYRLSLLMRGKMPVSSDLPYAWYDTPNIHFCTILDFEKLCRDKNIRILNKTILDARNRSSLSLRINPNLFGVNAIYQITR